MMLCNAEECGCSLPRKSFLHSFNLRQHALIYQRQKARRRFPSLSAFSRAEIVLSMFKVRKEIQMILTPGLLF